MYRLMQRYHYWAPPLRNNTPKLDVLLAHSDHRYCMYSTFWTCNGNIVFAQLASHEGLFAFHMCRAIQCMIQGQAWPLLSCHQLLVMNLIMSCYRHKQLLPRWPWHQSWAIFSTPISIFKVQSLAWDPNMIAWEQEFRRSFLTHACNKVLLLHQLAMLQLQTSARGLGPRMWARLFPRNNTQLPPMVIDLTLGRLSSSLISRTSTVSQTLLFAMDWYYSNFFTYLGGAYFICVYMARKLYQTLKTMYCP